MIIKLKIITLITKRGTGHVNIVSAKTSSIHRYGTIDIINNRTIIRAQVTPPLKGI
jgi:hypothetical protein